MPTGVFRDLGAHMEVTGASLAKGVEEEDGRALS